MLAFAFFLTLVILLVNDGSRQIYITLNNVHPYILCFLKVGILATFGEILALRVLKGKYVLPIGTFYRFIVWGFLGIVFVVSFELFGSGTKALLDKNLLPCTMASRNFLQAFYTSVLMNLIFAPVFMAFHRITDACIDLGGGKIQKMVKIKLDDAISYVDWKIFVNFVLLKTIPFFWIPAHTITFLLPSSYRVLVAALLSIVLGLILSIRKKVTKE